ncbi:hypothetical protein GCM10009540_60900 [Streptomyces turgidiscabies]
MKTLGFDGTEYKAVSKYKTFCSLCSRMVYKDEACFTWDGRMFFAHLNCNDEEVRTRMTNTEFRKTAKKTSKRPKKR